MSFVHECNDDRGKWFWKWWLLQIFTCTDKHVLLYKIIWIINNRNIKFHLKKKFNNLQYFSSK